MGGCLKLNCGNAGHGQTDGRMDKNQFKGNARHTGNKRGRKWIALFCWTEEGWSGRGGTAVGQMRSDTATAAVASGGQWLDKSDYPFSINLCRVKCRDGTIN